MNAKQLIKQLKAVKGYHDCGFGDKIADRGARHITQVVIGNATATIYTKQAIDYLSLFGVCPVELSIDTRYLVMVINDHGLYSVAWFHADHPINELRLKP